MSTEFFSLSPERVLEAVELFGFECTGRVLALNSLENRVYEVQTEDKEHPYVFVKFYRPNR
jgi:Ser/Thr protein kinase RdoA (MazF antagonist)